MRANKNCTGNIVIGHLPELGLYLELRQFFPIQVEKTVIIALILIFLSDIN